MSVQSVRWGDVVGQGRAAQILRAALDADQLGHAWLLVGPADIGQRELAVALAASLNCEEPAGPDACGTCRSCRRLLHETRTPAGTQSGHTVLREFYPEGAHHLVAAVREDWLPTAHRTLAEGNRRIVRIVQADRMNEAAQNAFLKALEEPPPSTVWLLEAEDDKALLETIVSRCRRLDLTAWTTDDLATQAIRLGMPADEAPVLARAANGSPRRLVEFRQRECPACGQVYWPDTDGKVRVVVDRRTQAREETTVCVNKRCRHCPSCHSPVKIADKPRRGPVKYPCPVCDYELESVVRGQEEVRAVTLLRDLARHRHVEAIRELADVGPVAVTGVARSVTAWAKASAGALEEQQAEEIAHLVEDFGVEEDRDLPAGLLTRTKQRHKREQRQQQALAVERFLDDLGTYLRDVLVVQAAGDADPTGAVVNVDRITHIRADAAQLPPAAAVHGLEQIAACRQALDEFNGQPELQLERVLMPLSVALYRGR